MHPGQNHLLAALPPPPSPRLLLNLEPIPMQQKWAICEFGDQMCDLYVPTIDMVLPIYEVESGFRQES